MSPVPISPRLRRDVQGLRAVAIVSVLLFHFFPRSFPNGFLGVDIFLVISGSLIVSSLSLHSLSPRVVVLFYYRRITRILPLSSLFILVASLTASIASPPSGIGAVKKSAWQALLYTTNIASITERENYFVRLSKGSLFTHFWSLSLEIQFYLLAPLFLLSSTHRRWVLVASGSASFVLFVLVDEVTSFGLPFTRLWQFFAVALFDPLLRGESKPSPPTALRRYFFHGSLALILLLCLFPVNVEGRLLVTLAAAYIIANGQSVHSPLLSNSFSVLVGDSSFVVYLVHWPFAVAAKGGHLADTATALVALSSLSLLLHFEFEEKYRRWSKKAVVSTITALSFAAAFVISHSERINDSFLPPVDPGIREAIRLNNEQFDNYTANMMNENCSYDPWPGLGNSRLEREHVGPPMGVCRMKNGHGRLRFLVIGNSFSANLMDLIWANFGHSFSTFVAFSQVACEIFNESLPPSCFNFVDYIKVMEKFPADVIFITSRHITAQWDVPMHSTDIVYEEMKEKLDTFIHKSGLFFVLDVLPEMLAPMNRLTDLQRMNYSAAEINRMVIYPKSLQNGLNRTKRLARYCGKKCIFYSVLQSFANAEGLLQAVDERSNLALFEPGSHVSIEGKRKLNEFYRGFAQGSKTLLDSLAEQIYGKHSKTPKN